MRFMHSQTGKHQARAPRPTAPHLATRVEAVRRFNRFYTQRIGVLREGLYESAYSLAEVRVLYELAHAEGSLTASDLVRTLTIDAGYLSRVLRGFEAKGLIRKSRSADDGRQWHLPLTATGRKAFAPLETASSTEVAGLLEPLSGSAKDDMVGAMAKIESLLGARSIRSAASTVVLRPHRPGDIGWVVARHGALYAQEYRWDMHFESLVARIAADFIDRFDAQREACWIAERDGANVGCVLLVQSRDDATEQPLAGVAQ